MASANKISEFRRYRQVLTAGYLGTVAFATVLLAGSVVKELFFRRPAVELPASSISVENPDPAELLECHGMVLSLLTELGQTTSDLLLMPLRADRSQVASSWQDFSRHWRDQWDVADARCQFSELGDANLGIAYGRLAKVHSDLQSMRLKYQSLLVRFDDEQAAELAQMRRALDLSHAALKKRVRERGPTPPTP